MEWFVCFALIHCFWLNSLNVSCFALDAAFLVLELMKKEPLLNIYYTLLFFLSLFHTFYLPN